MLNVSGFFVILDNKKQNATTQLISNHGRIDFRVTSGNAFIIVCVPSECFAVSCDELVPDVSGADSFLFCEYLILIRK